MKGKVTVDTGKYLIDACVLLAIANKQDVHHKSCVHFVEGCDGKNLYFPVHSLFEIQSGRLRRQRAGTYYGVHRVLKDVKFIDISKKIYDTSQKSGLFRRFSKLRGSDLIYACIAKIRKLTLVTCDDDFDAYRNEINIFRIRS